ncbi:hypothetical protein EU527_00300 [Candidatus Thorarchaeota archaeon]|nr:MAG: hypothetical protein EU527_00300 [Candidatus Thorarchaeota archaeon]
MVIRLKETMIDSIEDTETRRLKLIKISSKNEGAFLTIELPEVLCGSISEGDTVSIVIDSKEIVKGNESKLYLEGNVFKKSEKEGLEVTGSIGGLRIVVNLAKTTPSQASSFDSDKFFLAIN